MSQPSFVTLVPPDINLGPDGLPTAPTVPEWKGSYVGEGIFSYIPTGSQFPNNRLDLTGATPDKLPFKVARSHRLMRLELHHTDGSNVDASTTALTWSLIRFSADVAGTVYNLIEWDAATQEEGAAWSLIMGQGFEGIGPSNYELRFSGTSGNRVYPRIYIQFLR